MVVVVFDYGCNELVRVGKCEDVQETLEGMASDCLHKGRGGRVRVKCWPPLIGYSGENRNQTAQTTTLFLNLSRIYPWLGLSCSLSTFCG